MIALLLLSAALAGPDTPPALSSLPHSIDLSEAELRAVLGGQTVYRYEQRDGWEIGSSTTLVRAQPIEIWPHVLDVDAYVDFLPYVTASKNMGSRMEGGQRVHESQLDLTTKGITTHYQLESRWLEEADVVAFTVNSKRGAPLRSGVGWWTAQLCPEAPGHTLLSYQVQLDLAWYVPGSFRQKAATTGLPRLAALIGKRAEARP